MLLLSETAADALCRDVVTHAKPAAATAAGGDVVSESGEPPAKKPHMDNDSEHRKTVKKVGIWLITVVCVLYLLNKYRGQFCESLAIVYKSVVGYCADIVRKLNVIQTQRLQLIVLHAAS